MYNKVSPYGHLQNGIAKRVIKITFHKFNEGEESNKINQRKRTFSK